MSFARSLSRQVWPQSWATRKMLLANCKKAGIQPTARNRKALQFVIDQERNNKIADPKKRKLINPANYFEPIHSGNKKSYAVGRLLGKAWAYVRWFIRRYIW